MTSHAHTLAASPRAAIISPLVDALCAGGLSLLVLGPLLLLGRSDLLLFSPGVQAWVGALVNMPHFLAWYAAMAKVGLPALFTVQIAHALQYLIFPLRVEVNRTKREIPGGTPRELVALHRAVYLVVLLAGSIVAAIALPLGAMAVVTDWLVSRPGQVVGFAISTFFNIHHYFTDGVVWKLRNPAVREDLFGHLVTPAPVRAAPAMAAPQRRRRRR